MTLQKYIDYLQSDKSELKDKEIEIIAENGMSLEPRIKFVKEKGNLGISKENIEKIIITW